MHRIFCSIGLGELLSRKLSGSFSGRIPLNKSIKSSVKTAIKKVEAAVAEKDVEKAKAALLEATATIDKAATKGVYHKNNASRKVSRLAKAVNSIG